MRSGVKRVNINL